MIAFKRAPVRGWVALTILGLGALIAGLGLAGVHAQRKLTRVVVEDPEVLAAHQRLVGWVIEEHLAGLERELLILTKLADLKDALARNSRADLLEQIRPPLNRLGKGALRINRVTVYAPAGDVYLRAHAPDAYGDRFLDRRPLVSEAVTARRVVKGIESEGGVPHLWAAGPLYLNGRFLGVLEIGSPLAPVIDKIRRVSGHEAGIFDVNEAEKVIEASDPALLSAAAPLARAAAGMPAHRALTIQGKTYAALIIPVKEFSGRTAYLLVLLEDVSAIARLVRANNLTSFAISAMGFVLAAMLLFVLARRLTRLYGELELRVEERTRELAQKNTHLQALFETAHRATESLNLSDILPQLVRAAAELVGADASSIRLLDRSGTLLEALAHHNLSDAFAGRGPVRVGEGLTGRVFRDGQPVLVEDIEQDHRVLHREQLLAEGTRSAAIVPLRSHGRIIGVLTVYGRTSRSHSARDLDLLSQFADLAAVAIENARLYEDAQARLARMRWLTELSNLVNSSLDLRQIFEAVTEAALDLVKGDLARLWVADETAGVLRRVALKARNDDAVGVPSTAELPLHEGLVGWVMEHRETRYSPNLLEDPLQIKKDWVRAAGYVSQIAMPLVAADRALGALVVLTKTPRQFTQEEEELLELFADKAATAIENARLYRAAADQAEKLTALSELTRLMTSAGESQEVFRAVAMAATTLLGAKMARVWVADPEARVLRALGSFGIDTKIEQLQIEFPAIGYGQGLVGRILESRTPEYVLDIQQDPRWLNQRLFKETEVHAFAGIPLVAGNRVVGVLSVLFGERRRFTPEEKELLGLLADQAAITIERSYLFDQLKSSYEEIQRTQDQLVQSEKLRALGEMAAGVAHDFNNLLAAILGRAQFVLLRLAEGEVPPAEVRRNLGVIERAARDGAETVRRLLDFTRVAPRAEETEAVSVADLLASVVAASQPRWKDEAEAKGAHIEVVQELGDVPPLMGNPAELQEVFLNLVFNAIDAMPQGGTLTLASWAEDGDVCVAVKDTGVGIPENIRPKIFDPFFTTKGPQSSGLGLSVSYGIVRRHGGEITVESRVAQGTTFTVKLPVRPVPSPRAEAVSRPARPGLRVLVIDDEESVREILRDLLEAAGQEVWEASSGPEGLGILERQPMDLVCTDLGMPGMTGWEVAERIRARWPGLKVALITGWGARVEPEELEAHGMDLLIAKPFQMKDLLDILAKAAPGTIPQDRVESRG